jgi:hypothetical protein
VAASTSCLVDAADMTQQTLTPFAGSIAMEHEQAMNYEQVFHLANNVGPLRARKTEFIIAVTCIDILLT